jgi:hypothetical protein
MAKNGTDDRPEKPLRDPDIIILMRQVRTRTTTELYQNSYLSRSTISNLRKGKTRRPTHMTMTGIAAAAGLVYKLTPKD